MNKILLLCALLAALVLAVAPPGRAAASLSKSGLPHAGHAL